MSPMTPIGKIIQTINNIGYKIINSIQATVPVISKAKRIIIPMIRTIIFVRKAKRYPFRSKWAGYTSFIFFHGSRKFLINNRKEKKSIIK